MLDFTGQQHKTSERLKINSVHDRTWEIKTLHSGEEKRAKIDWSAFELPEDQVYLAKQVVLIQWSSKVISGLSTLPDNEARFAYKLLSILTIVHALYPKIKMKELSKNDWLFVIREYLFSKFSDHRNGPRHVKKCNQPRAKGQYEDAMLVISRLHDLYISGDIGDGPEYRISKPVGDKFLRKDFIKREMDFDRWLEGGSFGALPFFLSHLLLNDAIETIRSERTSLVLEYFSLISEHRLHHLVESFWDTGSNTDLYRYRHSGSFGYLSIHEKRKEQYRKTNECKERLAIPFHKRIERIRGTNGNIEFPWSSHMRFQENVVDIRSAVYIIFLSVMGKRGPSEIKPLKGVDLTPSDQDEQGKARIRPRIHKTHKGHKREHAVTTFIDEAFYVILNLDYETKENRDKPIFVTIRGPKSFRKQENDYSSKAVSRHGLGTGLKKYYDSFCARLRDKVHEPIEKIHPSITSHQFRHAFAEFGLRRFDGNVEEMIRQVFFHSHGHWWTKRYTAKKLDKEIEDSILRGYINELIPRIIQDSKLINQDFVGGMALYIKSKLSDCQEVMSPSEIDKSVESISDKIVNVTPHEYGWCLLHKDFQNEAKCKDINNKPNPSNTELKKCSACVNFVASRQSHRAFHSQVVISHQDFIEQKTFKMATLKKASKEAVSASLRLFPELEKLVDSNDC